MNLAWLPRFHTAGSDIKLRFPASGSYKLSTYVEKHIPWFLDYGVGLDVNLSAEMTIGLGQPAIEVDVNIDPGWTGDIADWFTGWEGNLKDRVKANFGDQLGFFSIMRYDPSISLDLHSPTLVYGFIELYPPNAIDIVLVSDGFTGANMGDFRKVVDEFETILTTSSPTHVNEPYFSLASVFRSSALGVLLSSKQGRREFVTAG